MAQSATADNELLDYEPPEYATDSEMPGSIEVLDDQEKTVGTETIHLDGDPITLTVERELLPRLSLDADNPRVYSGRVQAENQNTSFTNGNIEEYISDNFKIDELVDDIIDNGGLIHHLFIRDDGTVVEGNRRLTALREIESRLQNGELESKQMQHLIRNVPVKRFPSDVDETDIQFFVGREHISGKEEWGSFEKARYLYKLYQELGTYTAVGEKVGYSNTHVSDYVRAYELSKVYVEEYGQDEYFVFDHFMSADKYKNEYKQIDIDLETQDGKEEFARMMYNDYFDDTYDVRNLPKVMQHEETKEKWEKGYRREAKEDIYDVDPVLYGKPFSTLAKVKEQLENIDSEDESKFEEDAFHKVAEEVHEILEEYL